MGSRIYDGECDWVTLAHARKPYRERTRKFVEKRSPSYAASSMSFVVAPHRFERDGEQSTYLVLKPHLHGRSMGIDANVVVSHQSMSVTDQCCRQLF